MLGYYNYTVILTYISLCISVLGIHFAICEQPVYALICLMVSGFCDMFDGPVARTMERTEEEKEFGIQIDSLTDLICFGVFPAIIAYSIGLRSTIAIIVLVLYVLCAMIRLAYFNVQESNRQKETTEKRKYYQGLPVTTVAIIFPFVFLLKKYIPQYFVLIYGLSVFVIAMLFIMNINIKKAGKREMGFMSIIAICEFVLLLRLL